jgi:ceramide glucosyltransferase
MDTLIGLYFGVLPAFREVLPWVGVFAAVATVLIAWWGSEVVRRHFRPASPASSEEFAAFPITVLKPLCGADPGLIDNLRSFLWQDYPAYEVIFSVADSRDSAIDVVRRLLEEPRSPGCSVRLIVGAEDVGINPKVNNLIRGFEQAAHEWLLISDSNVRAEPRYLRHLARHVDSRTGLVTQVVAGVDGEGGGGLLEEVFLNSFYARNGLMASVVGRPCVVGKCMLFSREVIDRIGGIRSLANHLAEDYVAGERIHALGLKVVTAREPVRQVIGNHSLKSFWLRHVRWGRIRRAQAPLIFLIEPFATPFGSGLLLAFSWPMVSEAGSGVAAFCSQILLCLLADLRVMPRLGTESIHKLIGGWLLREALHLPLWLNIYCGKRVTWRGQRLTLGRGGVLVAAEPIPVKATSA